MLLYLATKVAWKKKFFLVTLCPVKIYILRKRGIADRECVCKDEGLMRGEEELHLGPWALMIGGPGHCSFAILGLKLLYPNS